MLALVCLSALLGACEWNFERRESAIPPRILEANDAFLDAIGRGDSEAAGNMMASGTLDETARAQLAEFAADLLPYQDVRITRGRYDTSRTPGLQHHHRLTSQLSAASTFYMVALEFRDTPTGVEIQSIQFTRRVVDRERMNRFTFEERTAMYPIAFLIGSLATGFVVWALIDCWRRKPVFWWIWLPAIMIGFPEFTLNWTSGVWDVGLDTVVPFAIGFVQISRIHPFVLQIGAPIGALLWWIARTRDDLAHENQGVDFEDEELTDSGTNESAS